MSAWVISYLLFFATLTLAPHSTHIVDETCAQSTPCATGVAKPGVTPPNQTAHFPAGFTVYVTIDPTMQPYAAQVKAALDNWNTANQTNGSNIFYDYNNAPQNEPNGSAAATLLVTQGVVNVAGSSPPTPSTQIAAQTQPQRTYADGTLQSATVVINTATLASPNNPSSGPYYDPTLPGFDTIFEKQMAHETGHMEGLTDAVPINQQQSGASAMNNGTAGCPNDVCPTGRSGDMTTGPTPCDNSVVNQVYPPGSGGAGGGGINPFNDDLNSDGCGTDSYIEEYDYYDNEGGYCQSFTEVRDDYCFGSVYNENFFDMGTDCSYPELD